MRLPKKINFFDGIYLIAFLSLFLIPLKDSFSAGWATVKKKEELLPLKIEIKISKDKPAICDCGKEKIKEKAKRSQAKEETK